MNKRNITFGLSLSVFIFLAVLVASPLTVLARDADRPDRSARTSDDSSETVSQQGAENENESEVESENETERETPNAARESRSETARERLDDAKKKTCAEREAKINAVMDRIVERSQKHVDRITAVSDKVKAFYVAKGNTLSNYDELVANVEQKRVVAQVAVDALSSGATFSCDSDGPRADVQNFRADRSGKIEAIKSYRSAVKDLIVGVKSVQPDQTSTEEQS